MPTPVTDLTGKTFGMLTVVGRHNSKGKPIKWDCLCSCGNSKVAVGAELKRGRTTHCGCVPSNQKEMRGKKYGMLTPLFPCKTRAGKNKAIMWWFQCDCGNITCRKGSSVRAGYTKSCGCLSGNPEQHGMTGTPEHDAWCRLPDRPAEWDKFSEFFRAVGERPSPEHHIDRHDINEPHGPTNTYWRDPNEYSNLGQCLDLGLDVGAIIANPGAAVAAQEREEAAGRAAREEAERGDGPLPSGQGFTSECFGRYQEAPSSSSSEVVGASSSSCYTTH